jgi:hypothetical protein
MGAPYAGLPGYACGVVCLVAFDAQDGDLGSSCSHPFLEVLGSAIAGYFA